MLHWYCIVIFEYSRITYIYCIITYRKLWSLIVKWMWQEFRFVLGNLRDLFCALNIILLNYEFWILSCYYCRRDLHTPHTTTNRHADLKLWDRVDRQWPHDHTICRRPVSADTASKGVCDGVHVWRELNCVLVLISAPDHCHRSVVIREQKLWGGHLHTYCTEIHVLYQMFE